ncbi:hypothetical protein HYU11_06180 [Candidatus Woesearchaeota archaeon]|nr:hypothetical protein [Candidatus Woesearchaeota archaeon]
MRIPDFGKITMRLFGNIARTEHLLLQEIKVKKGSKLTKRTKFEIVRDTGVIVMAAKSPRSKRYMINVPFKSRIKAGSIIAMGTVKQLNEFEQYTRK